MILRIAYILISAILLVSAGLPVVSVAQQAEEYALKASYIERFMQFVTWPDKDIDDSSRPFVISVLGKNPFNGGLEDVFAKHSSDGREVQVNYISEVEEAINCDVLFLARSKKDDLSKILEIVSDKPILTIGDTRGFFNAGVIINFYVESDRLQFEINLKAARKSDIVFDPFLLDYAVIPDSAEVSDDEP